MDLIYTIEHTGTHSLQEMVGPIEQWHCDDDREPTGFDNILTTSRDPLRVAASWANRYGRNLDSHPRVDIYEKWCKQWANWAKVKAKVYTMDDLDFHKNTYQDKLKLHEALDNNDMDYYYTYVPRKFIDFAERCING